jgi:hypothetical protein
MKSDLFSGESRPPEDYLLWFFVRFVRSCDFAALSVVFREAATTERGPPDGFVTKHWKGDPSISKRD